MGIMNDDDFGGDFDGDSDDEDPDNPKEHKASFFIVTFWSINCLGGGEFSCRHGKIYFAIRAGD